MSTKKKEDVAGEQIISDSEYSAAQARLLDVLVNPESKYITVTQICAKAKCSRATYYRAFKDRAFADRYRADLKALSRSYIGPVLHAFYEQAVRGSFQHGKVLLEMGGLYVEPRDITMRNPPGESFRTEGLTDKLKELSVEDLLKLARRHDKRDS